MSKDQDNFVRYQVRLPDELYQQLAAIAIQKGAKLHPRTKRPQLSETIAELLQFALEQKKLITEESPTQRSPDLELIQSWILAYQNQQSQQLNQQLNTVLEAQHQTQAELNRLYLLYHKLCEQLNPQATKEKTGYSHSSSQQIRPLETYSAGPWMVNRQWLSLNGCFNEEAFNQWNTGEVRQDHKGNFWRRVDLDPTGEQFQIPSSVAESQTFYVLAE